LLTGRVNTWYKEISMGEPIHDKLFSALKSAGDLYYRLVLLVGKTGSGKTKVLQTFADELGTSVINLNLELSGELLDLTVKQRALRLPEILARIIDKRTDTVILDNLEILFARDLKQDPLRLLQRFSRNRIIVASWNGTFAGRKLIYAETGHSEYRSYDSVDAMIVEMS